MKAIMAIVFMFIYSESLVAGCSGGSGYYCKNGGKQICFSDRGYNNNDICVKFTEEKYGSKSKRIAARNSIIGKSLGFNDTIKKYYSDIPRLEKDIKTTENRILERQRELSTKKKEFQREASKLGLSVTGTGLKMSFTGDASPKEMRDLADRAEALESKYKGQNGILTNLEDDIRKQESAMSELDLNLTLAEQDLADQYANYMSDALDEKKNRDALKKKAKEAKALAKLIKKARKKIRNGDLDEVLESSKFAKVEMEKILDEIEQVHDNAEMGLYMQAKLSRVETNFCGAVNACNQGKKPDLGLDDIFTRKTEKSGNSNYKRIKRGAR